MVAFRDKSHFNRQAAELCLKNTLYAPSVHCSYYSCIQFILFILYEKLKITEQTFNERKAFFHTGTHACAIKLMGLDLINKAPADYKMFQKLVPELKDLRERSDYTNLTIRQEDGYLAMNNSDSIKNLLQRNYR